MINVTLVSAIWTHSNAHFCRLTNNNLSMRHLQQFYKPVIPGVNCAGWGRQFQRG